MTASLSPLPIFQKIPWLAVLDEPVLRHLAETTTLRRYSAGELVFLEGDLPPFLFVIHSGWLKAVKLSPEGREQILDFVGPGQAINLAPIFAEQPSPATLVALEAAELWLIDQAVLLELLARYPVMARGVIRFMATRLLYTLSLVEDLSLRSVRARLAKLLVMQTRAGEMVLARRSWATQAGIAARLGTVPDVAQRALRSLAQDGLIEVTRRQIIILNVDGLKKASQL
jgi:CRP/FNR family transcriptional regulator